RRPIRRARGCRTSPRRRRSAERFAAHSRTDRTPPDRAEPGDRQGRRSEGGRRRLGARRARRAGERCRDRWIGTPPSRTTQRADLMPDADDDRDEAREEREMPELTMHPDESAAALRKHVESFTPSVEKAQIGRVLEVGDGIARVAGLPSTSVNELLEFEGGTLGLALNLDEDSIGAVVLGEASRIEEGAAVKGTGRILSVVVGDALTGRVVNALGQSIDGKGPINSPHQRRLEVQAPGIVGREPVSQPLQTGIKAIDAMTPIGRGQRELIIGDRKTGKTTVAVDTI